MPDANTILTYNGIDLQIGRVLNCRQRAVYDDTGTDYLYTHFLVEVACTWNPRATASTVTNALGDTPAASLSFLRHKLLQPRQSLQINVGGDTLLVSPQINADAQVPFATDANNGPHPISLDVLSVHGSKTILCTYQVETWLNECAGSQGSPPPTILSHRWEMSEEISSEYLSTRTITGRAVFRTDFLLAENDLPDDFRAYLFHPCPPGFRRVSVTSTPESDGTALSYTIVDEEQVWPLNGVATGAGIIEVSGQEHVGWDWIGWTNPILFYDLHAQVWGEPWVKNTELVKALLHVLAAAGGNVGRDPAFAAEVTVDFPRRHAALTYRSMVSGKVAGGVLAAGLLPGVDPWPNVNANKWIPDLGILGGYGVQNTVTPPGDGGSRGDSLARIFAQVNNRPCTAPTQVSATGTALRAGPAGASF